MGEQIYTDEAIHLIIIGAGLAGLSAALSTKLANPAHRVTVLETVKQLQEVGAGLQITPNGTRLLSAWGLTPQLAPVATVPTALSVHRYDGTKLLAREPALQSTMAARYGHPFWDLHRVDLQQAMLSRCAALGVAIQLNARAVRVDFDDARVHLHDGRVVEGDVVLLADGLWSQIRPQFLGRPSPAILTGDLAYRITVRVDELEGDDAAELRAFVADEPTVDFWVGPRSHCVGYPVRAGQVYNLVLLCPDDLPGDVVKLEGDKDEMRERFRGWDPLLGKFLRQVKGVVHKWKLMWLDALPEWANEGGTFFMAGDCCHPMLPYLAQGANSSLEDGAVLGSLLGKVRRSEMKRQLPCVSKMYQDLRMERGRRIQLETFRQRDDSHLEDGEAQERRDALMLSMLGKKVKAPFPSRWTCPKIQKFLYGYDAYAEAEKAYKEKPF
ncbi:FAD/NAD(P)-binding domain-containing protein [Parathielavia appendiculata]|uniref:FAD/NAD(P)-binding domain-containing protein n=1 Tax=Parathielavia appendiculata TaxID=2587402 RepID=A0AAN6TX60_9PEZI|nr:FAD/NAD(P)-binding domain-containing protein [Parathielavia appendiculata]